MCWLPSRHSARRLEELSRSSRGLEGTTRSEEHTSELQSQSNLVCRLLLEKKKECRHCTRPAPARLRLCPRIPSAPSHAERRTRPAATAYPQRRGRAPCTTRPALPSLS